MTRILIIDDDKALVRALHIAMTARGYEITVATTATQALDAATHTTPDLTIVDLGLPDMDGLHLVIALRGWLAGPIIVLSARHAEQSKIAALDAGADDYITKPFGMGELLARVRAALRRSSPGTDQPVIVTAAFRIDLAGKTVTTQAGEVRLTPTEWQLLELLVRNPGKLVTHQQLLHEVWGSAYEDQTPYLRVHVGNLRRKLEPDPIRPRYLRTDPGLGYRFMPDDES